MTRLPRFKRSPEIPPIKLTDRDREILRHVHRHRFLRSDHLVALTAGSPQQMLRRLQRLFHHGYLDRPHCQLDYYQSGSRRMAYVLGNKGVAWVKRALSHTFLQLHWPRKCHIGRLFLEHALLISDIMVAIELTCRQRPDIRLLSTEDLNVPKAREPFQWQVNIGTKCGVIPDRVFGFEINGKRWWYFLEADRATMPITRANLEQTSIQRKFLAYEATWTQGIHRRDFGIHRFRVLTISTEADRVKGIIEACRKLNQGRGLFLFNDINTMKSNPDLLLPVWQTVREGEKAALVD